MTKWSRIRRRKERRRAESEERRKAEEPQTPEPQTPEPQVGDLSTQQEKITENVQPTEKRSMKRFSMFKKPSQHEKSSKNIQQVRENVEQENTQTIKQKSILSQIPRYVYLVAFFALLSGVFFPLITSDPTEQNLNNVLAGTAILFLGLVGAILVYKGTTANKNRAAVVSFGLVLITISLALIFTIAAVPTY
tara:strand:+ start:70 stop:645 length:576 start_codon:yes stop_codon:yes gene_type:complete